MAIRPIRTMGDPVLKSKCSPIKKIDESLERLIKDMGDTMYDAPGVGLAAPQIGVNKHVVVYDIGEGLEVILNPEIVETDEGEEGVEGCLSVPGEERAIKRANWIKVRGLDRYGEEFEKEFSGFAARVLQHEIDHLQGKLIIQRGRPLPKKEIED